MSPRPVGDYLQDANADMGVGEIRLFCRLQDEGQSLMRVRMTQLHLSVRADQRIPKLARRIADLVEALQAIPSEADDGGEKFQRLFNTEKHCRLSSYIMARKYHNRDM